MSRLGLRLGLQGVRGFSPSVLRPYSGCLRLPQASSIGLCDGWTQGFATFKISALSNWVASPIKSSVMLYRPYITMSASTESLLVSEELEKREITQTDLCHSFSFQTCDHGKPCLKHQKTWQVPHFGQRQSPK